MDGGEGEEGSGEGTVAMAHGADIKDGRGG